MPKAITVRLTESHLDIIRHLLISRLSSSTLGSSGGDSAAQVVGEWKAGRETFLNEEMRDCSTTMAEALRMLKDLDEEAELLALLDAATEQEVAYV